MLKRIFLSFLFIIFIFVSLCINISCAISVPVTDENLNEALQKFVSSEANEENYNISISNNFINVIVDNENYTLSYDLTDKPTFSMELPIQKGISYEEFEKKTENLILPMLGYVAVANIQGVEIEDASVYFLFSYLGSALKGSFSSENSYIIVDDLNFSEGVTIEKTDNPKTIYTSEFGDRVIEYVNNMYKEKKSISDPEGINSYLLTIEKSDTTDTSCKLVSTLSVNNDADFSKISEYVNEIKEPYDSITSENADYKITLKVGQKCKIESSEEFHGYETYMSCVEIDTNLDEITAIKAGTTKGYIYVGDKKKTIYITVEENKGNETLETIILKLDNTTDSNISNSSNITDNIQNSNNTTKLEILPRTGEESNIALIILYIIVSICSISLVTLLFISKKIKTTKSS